MFDLVHHMRPAPSRVNLIQQRAGRVVQPRRGGLLGLQVVAGKTGPTLQRVMVPGAARHVLIHVQVAVGQNVEPGAFLITDDDGHRVLKFFAKPDVEHAGVELAAPHAYVKPARAWKRSGGGAGKN